MPYKDYQKQKESSLRNYHNNRDKILKYQKDRLKRKYKEDAEFRKKRNLRDKSRYDGHNGKTKLSGHCLMCESTTDLQRHHPNYTDTFFVILCRKCHNQIHKNLKEGKIVPRLPGSKV